MNLRERIIQVMRETAEMQGKRIEKELNDDAILLDTGLDSLGFAILVAKLEEELGYDPFVLMTEPYYPRTFADFVGIYERYSPKS